MTKILWKYTFTYIIVMAESNDWTQVRKCEANPESKWNSYQEKLQKEAQDRERENRYKLEERERAEKAIFDEFGYHIKEEHLIQQGFKKVIPFQCVRCKDVKALPYQFLNKFNKVSQTNTCSECTKTRSDQVKKCTEQNMCSCVCGITYYCSSDRAMVLHEQSDRHKKALRRNRLIEGKRYKRDELRLLCRTNSIPYYNSLKVEDMIDKLLSLEDITIPEL